MNRKEEIREGFIEIVRTNLSGQGLIDSNLYDGFCAVLEDAISQGFEYLHSAGCVLKVSNTMPIRCNWCWCNYVWEEHFTVEPLIEEE